MEETTVTVTVSLGRNIGLVPMSDRQWQRFTRNAKIAIRSRALATHYIGIGTGIYEGNEEQSLTLIATVRATQLASLRDALRLLAREHAQDSIALTVGTTEFLAP